MSKYDNLNTRSILGIGLIIFAVLLFLSNIGIPLLGMVVRNWPVLLIILGIIMLNRRRGKRQQNGRRYLPHVLIGAGVLFQLANMHILNFGLGAILIPVILLFVGFQLIRSQSAKSAGDSQFENQSEGVIEGELVETGNETSGQNAKEVKAVKIDMFTLLGGGKFATRSNNVTGGNATAILGGVEIDIREAESQSKTIEIEVISIMGGVEIQVPPHFSVSSKVLPILAGVTDTTTCLAHKLGVPEKHLIISGVAILGGVEITN